VNVIDVLTFGQRDVEGLLARFRRDDWDAPALGTWTAKDLVAHLGAFEARFADILATFAGESAPTDLMRADTATFNDDQAAIRRDWPLDAVLAELRDAFERGIALARRIPLETWTRVGSIPWYGAAYALDDLAVYSMYGHKREHAPQLEAVLERPGRT
jgi:hypothetical protein